MDQKFVQRTIELAKKGVGFTSPNPAVGAVIVKNKKIIGEGWHKRAGGKHAERGAIQDIRDIKDIRGATMYVTLEPCCHWGKTPPCVEAIIAAGIKKVVVGMKDPFEKVNGKGIAFLKKHDVQIELLNTKSVQYKEIRKLNQPFIKWATTGLPYVVLKAAISLDGKIATRTGESKWITSSKAREDARLERSLCDAVIVGAGTVAADNPELGEHGKFRNKKLLRVIIDPMLTSDVKKKVFRDENVFVACTVRTTIANRRRFEKAGIECRSFGQKNISIKRLLEYLGKRNIQKVFVEGGAGVHGMFLDECKMQNAKCKIIDEVIFYIAPKIIGGTHALSAVGGEGVKKLSDALQLSGVNLSQVGEDVKVRGIFKRY